MITKKLVLVLVPLLLVINSAYAGVHPAVQMAASTTESQNIVALGYATVVPPLPSACCSAAYEIHAGIVSAGNQTFIKTTVSYGCQISETKPCFGPFLPRYIFYLSIINQSSKARVQLPSQGWALTPGGTYKIGLAQVAACSGETYPAWAVKITNGTSSWSTTVCGDLPILQGRTFNVAEAGVLEVHNITACSDFSASNGEAQSSITVLNGAGQTLPLSWIPNINPGQPDCGFNLTFTNNNRQVNVVWNSAQ